MVDQAPHIAPKLQEILAAVSDPEIPVLSILEMGVVREAILKESKAFVKITPTYSGCPAMDVIGDDIKAALKNAGFDANMYPAGNSQNPKLFNLGNATSFVPKWYGIKKLAKTLPWPPKEQWFRQMQ